MWPCRGTSIHACLVCGPCQLIASSHRWQDIPPRLWILGIGRPSGFENHGYGAFAAKMQIGNSLARVHAPSAPPPHRAAPSVHVRNRAALGCTRPLRELGATTIGRRPRKPFPMRPEAIGSLACHHSLTCPGRPERHPERPVLLPGQTSPDRGGKRPSARAVQERAAHHKRPSPSHPASFPQEAGGKSGKRGHSRLCPHTKAHRTPHTKAQRFWSLRGTPPSMSSSPQLLGATMASHHSTIRRQPALVQEDKTFHGRIVLKYPARPQLGLHGNAWEALPFRLIFVRKTPVRRHATRQDGRLRRPAVNVVQSSAGVRGNQAQHAPRRCLPPCTWAGSSHAPGTRKVLTHARSVTSRLPSRDRQEDYRKRILVGESSLAFSPCRPRR